MRLTIDLRAADGRIVKVRILNIADQGLLLETDSPLLSIGDVIEVELPDAGLVTAEIKWAAPPFFGCQIDGSLTGAQLAAALLKADPLPYRVSQGATALSTGTLQEVRSDPVPNFSMAFLIMAAFWGVVALLLLALA